MPEGATDMQAVRTDAGHVHPQIQADLMNHPTTLTDSRHSFPHRSWTRWTIAVLLMAWWLNPSLQAQNIDLNGWNLRTEQSGSFLCTSNRWQQVEMLSGSSITWEGTYTATRQDAQTLQIKAEPEYGTTRTWVLHFENANAGTYTLDYLLFDDYAIHEEGRFYNSQTSLWYADWAQMTGQTQNGPEQVGIPDRRVGTNHPARDQGQLVAVPRPRQDLRPKRRHRAGTKS
jgi:hypothetical protein